MTNDVDVERHVVGLLTAAMPRRRRTLTITREMEIQRDLGIDSLGMVALILQLEETLDISLVGGGTRLNDIRTVGDAVRVVRAVMQRTSDARS